MSNDPRISQQYRRALAVGGYLVREDRAILVAEGADRATWLNNLVTNVVKTLSPGEGNYAFATNVKGRVIFDLNILALPDRLWLDVDRRLANVALEHLTRHIITEDVRVAPLAPAPSRIAVLGPQAPIAVQRLGFATLPTMAWLQHESCPVAGAEARLIRNDFCGLVTADIVFAGESAAAGLAAARAVCEDLGLAAIEPSVAETLRIEAGIPASVEDIDGEVVPPETGEIERGISYHKGCYLGQEVIERMRSHGILARKLVAMKIRGERLPEKGATIRAGQNEVGRVTSSCWSESMQAGLSLGYVKSAQSGIGTKMAIALGDLSIEAEIVSKPAVTR